LGLDLRHADFGARLREQALDHGDGVFAVGVDDDERTRGTVGVPRADAHGVLVFGP
jgi:hypothetical protein